MDTKTQAVLVTVAFSLVGVLGDYFLKLASAEEHSLRSPAFVVGFLVYASTAFGWLFVMKHLKLGTIGVIYSMSMIVLLASVGVVGFGERLSGAEVAGLLLAIASLVLLVRFA
jgi:small multidrug resistance pump